MSIQPQPTVNPAVTVKVTDWDFNASRTEVKVSVTIGDFAGVAITAHWEQFCEWCEDYYAPSGYNWQQRTFTVLVERSGSRYDTEDYDLEEVTVDAVEWLNEQGFGEEEQAAFFRGMVGQIPGELQ